MPAFAAPPALPTRRPRCASRCARAPRMSRGDIEQLKRRSVFAMRGFSDFGGFTVLHELAAKGALSAGMAEGGLAFGGLVGLWTVSLFAERLREQRRRLISESEGLPGRWDSALVYTPEVGEDDVLDAVAWLYAFGELEGMAASDLLWDLAKGDARMRCSLAYALGRYPIRSNVCVAILNALATDSEERVSAAAAAALDRYADAGIRISGPRELAPVGGAPQQNSKSVQGVADGLVAGQKEESELRELLSRLLHDDENRNVGNGSAQGMGQQRQMKQHGEGQERRDGYRCRQLPSNASSFPSVAQDGSSWILEELSRFVEDLGSVALTQQSPLTPQTGEHQHLESQPTSATSPPDVRVPLYDGLFWSEVHGLCLLAVLPVAYELYSMLFNPGGQPLRFVGLGWLLTVGGLIAYPQSGRLWQRMQETFAEMDGGVVESSDTRR